jgi:hypothetical protein
MPGGPGGASHRCLTKKQLAGMCEKLYPSLPGRTRKCSRTNCFQVLRSSFEAGACRLFALGGLTIRAYWVHAPPYRLGWSRWGEVAH